LQHTEPVLQDLTLPAVKASLIFPVTLEAF